MLEYQLYLDSADSWCVRTGIPHEAEQDDIYEGYFIPKGSFIHPSQW